MKNPFQKNDHKLLLAVVLFGSIAAGAAAYFFRDEIAGYFDGVFTKEPDNEDHGNEQGYLHHRDKGPKTDREALIKNEILHESGRSSHEDVQQS
ncbi:hypothetical protein [Mucilaginibacter kameinonensis]|uniref:hypothetical protein n=1 Tax=Mucilaginibacter kameinonensis TaxID=452286 RepID=UPI0013CEC331|nr:hypothetical protein [Mucilaginibacter kameinonensis]